MQFTRTEIDSIGGYLRRKLQLPFGLIEDALQDGLLAVLEKGAKDLQEAKWIALGGAVDAHRRRYGRTEKYAAIRDGVIYAEELDPAHSVTVDSYPSETDRGRILAWAEDKPERTQRIVCYILAGYTYEDVGSFEGISVSRVCQILNGYKSGSKTRI